MYTICKLSVHYLCTVCTQLYTISILSVYYLFTVCTLSVHCLYTTVHYLYLICTLSVHYVYTVFTQRVHHLYTAVHYLYTICTLSVHHLYSIVHHCTAQLGFCNFAYNVSVFSPKKSIFLPLKLTPNQIEFQKWSKESKYHFIIFKQIKMSDRPIY